MIGYFVLLSTNSIRLVLGGEFPKLVAFISMIFSPSCSLYFIFLRLFLVLTSFNTILPFIIKVILSPSSLFASQMKNLSFLLSQLIVKSSPSFNICVLLTGEVSSLSFSICFSIVFFTLVIFFSSFFFPSKLFYLLHIQYYLRNFL